MLLNTFQNYLSSNNIKSTVTPINEEETAIMFEKDSLNYVFLYNSTDKYYFRLILPSIAIITETDNKDRHYNIINDVNNLFKAVKVIMFDNGQIWANVEQYVFSYENVNYIFERALKSLKDATIYYHQELKK